MNAIIGIDLSWSNTGLAALNQSGEVLQFRSIKTNPKDDKWKRANRIVHEILEFVDQFGTSLIAIEGYSFGSKFNRENMGEIGGIVRYNLWIHKYEFIDISPTNLKKFATGKGNATKEEMVSYANSKGFQCKDHNVCDAFALAKMLQEST
jgi:crossover junction endodeoxyribonuclease RuvC